MFISRDKNRYFEKKNLARLFSADRNSTLDICRALQLKIRLRCFIPASFFPMRFFYLYICMYINETTFVRILMVPTFAKERFWKKRNSDIFSAHF